MNEKILNFFISRNDSNLSESLQKLGPTWIKMGQFLSTRPDVIGKELSDQIPLYIDRSSKLPLPSTQYDMYSSENAGLVKFDLLGLKTLTVIDKAQKLINKKLYGGKLKEVKAPKIVRNNSSR